MRFIPALLAALLAAGVSSVAFADTTDVKTQTTVEVKKKGAHSSKTLTALTVTILQSSR